MGSLAVDEGHVCRETFPEHVFRCNWVLIVGRIHLLGPLVEVFPSERLQQARNE